MDDETLHKYISEKRFVGKPDDLIRRDLLLLGWGEGEIDAAMSRKVPTNADNGTEDTPRKAAKDLL